ncbi:Cytochrome P450 monooxygenase [Psilocybe cubensis]|uniref:Cytochrome P450 monooxygenase n=2 Tax=Psilocybe cubensis TaxID=181762 RepID=A0ACB8GLL0_PSICU|nr:Cytochrome P450 monooxygenase [Psilocybe cubensis]KAH9476428.1 Cytochrome P450 monooxygenase [Psilocybe cubensis]
MKDTYTFATLFLAAVAWLTFKIARIGRRDGRLPPGPPTVPVLGNIHELPRKFAFLRFSEWGRKYGGIISIKLANATAIVVSDLKVVKELLDDRSSETSSRPYSYALEALSKGNFFVLASSESLVWRASRKSIQPFLAVQASDLHVPIVERESSALLHGILHNPGAISSHILRYTFSSIAYFAFGKRVLRHDSPELQSYQTYIRNFCKAVSPEAAPVDLIPILRYVPDFLAPWMKLWRETRSQQLSLYNSFLEHAERVKEGEGRNRSIIQATLEQRHELGLSRETVAYTGGVLLDAGTETLATTMLSLILCLMKSPAVLKKAQNEIDELIGSKRLPVANDIEELPYIQAIIKEVLRFRPSIPTGIPHAPLNDCHYGGYTIPKGSAIFINTWAIFHDPDLFERPDDFWPERYLLTPDGTKPGLNKDYNIRSSLSFGSGKRLCPGMNFARTSLNVAVMRLIWAFDFEPGDNSSRMDQSWSLEEHYFEGITLTPKEFSCRMTLRSADRAKAIEDSYILYENSNA